jgi:hypothetical protein
MEVASNIFGDLLGQLGLTVNGWRPVCVGRERNEIAITLYSKHGLQNSYRPTLVYNK